MRLACALPLLALLLAACGPADDPAYADSTQQQALDAPDGGAGGCDGGFDAGCGCPSVVVVYVEVDAGPPQEPPTDSHELSGSGCSSTRGADALPFALLAIGLALLARRKRAALLAVLVAPGLARAEPLAPGFAIDRFDPAERGSRWLVNDDLAFGQGFQPTLGITAEYADAPLVLRNRETGEAEPLVARQLVAHLGASFVVGNRVRFGTSLPMALDTQAGSGELSGLQYAPQSGAAPGDMRLGADVRLFGDPGGPIVAALGARIYAPTGTPAAFTGDGHARAGVRAALAGSAGPLRYALSAMAVARPESEQVPLGSGATLAAAVGWQSASGKVRVGPEVFAALDRSSAAVVSTASAPSGEALLDAHVQLGALSVGVGAGPGLTRGVGTPRWRALASLEWSPPPEAPPVRDTDGDGIVDARDACPEVRGEPDPNPERNGCPHPPPDRDRDGIPDAQDACPDQVGPASSDPARNGCPLPQPDRDGDGVPDAEDACPDKPGLADGDPRQNGCPPPDRDGDGVPDAQDECPDKPGSPELGGCPGSDRDGDGVADRLDNCPSEPGPAENQGCPANEPQRVALTRDHLVLRESVEFADGTATLEPGSEALLDQVARVLKNHPELVSVMVEGHADDHPSADANRRLSEARADAVVRYLVRHGVARTRLATRGYGDTRSLVPEDGSAEAHRQNRRIELRIFAAVR